MDTGVGCQALLQGIFPTQGSNPGIKPRSPALQADSLPSEPRGKPKNPGVGGLLLPQGIFLTQESNQCLLHCRQILYQLSYQGTPRAAVYLQINTVDYQITEKPASMEPYLCSGWD